MAGRGRGGRGLRLQEALSKLQSSQLGAEESSTSASQTSQSAESSPPSSASSDQSSPQNQSPPQQSREPSPQRSSSPEAGPSVVPAIGGRGKLKQYILKKPVVASESDTQSEKSDKSDKTSGGSKTSSPTSQSSDTPSSPGVSAQLQQATISGDETSPQPSTSQQRRPDPRIENKQRGTEGRTLDVCVNYVRIKRDKNKGVYEYHVDFEPQIDSINIRRKVLHSEPVAAIIGSVFQFTGINMYLPMQLQEDPITISTTLFTDGSPVKIKIKFIKVPPYEELIPFFNTAFRRIMNKLRLVQMARHHYDPTLKIDIPQHKLEVWPGYATAIMDYDGGLMLNCDASHRVLRTSTARDVLQEILSLPDGRSRFKDIAQKRLVGCVVLTRYNNKPYRVDDVLFDKNPDSTFQLSNGEEITYMEYFKKSWNIEIRDRNQPLLCNKPKPKKGQTEAPMICLIPELSYMSGLTDDIRSDTRAMRDIASHTRIKPLVRQQKLTEFIRNVNTNSEARKILSDWGFQLEDRPLDAKARQVQPERLFFGKNKAVDVNFKAEWRNDVLNSTLLAAIPIERWVLIFTKRDAQRADEFARTLQQVSRNMGFSFANPRRVEIRDEMPTTYVTSIKESCTGAQLVVLMTPGSSQREDRYSAIKRLLCCDMPIPSQVVRSNTLQGTKMRSVCQNIALQITCKVGGQLWGVKIPFTSCMIVGLDVYHDATHKGRSVVGVVASLNQGATRWFTRVYFQNAKEEIASILQSATVACLKKFYEVNNALPARVFIFRDGVGDGQLGMVRDYEIPQMEEAIESYIKFQQSVRPTVSVVVVQKRINMKMMMKKGNDLDNPPPGSIMDHTVTRPQFYDFYLISQHVTQGTVTPTHYVTVYDKNNMTPDRMQRLTYKMTYLYYNFPATIRVPAPCQYAHKVAYLVGQNVKKAPADSLCDKLFFL